MFKASLGDAKLLKHSIDAIANMIDEAGLSAGKDGLRLRAMDPAHVALVDYELKKEAFEEFEISEPVVLGLDMERLNTILKRSSPEDRVSLELDEENNQLRIKLRGTAMRTFNLPLIDVSEEELKVPSLDFLAVVEVDPKLVSEGIKDAEVVSDHVTLKVDAKDLYILAKGDLGSAEVKIEKEQATTFEVKKECRSMFSIEYLKDMIRASEIATSVKISLGSNVPVKMDFLAGAARLSFLLAPRIESE